MHRSGDRSITALFSIVLSLFWACITPVLVLHVALEHEVAEDHHGESHGPGDADHAGHGSHAGSGHDHVETSQLVLSARSLSLAHLPLMVAEACLQSPVGCFDRESATRASQCSWHGTWFFDSRSPVLQV